MTVEETIVEVSKKHSGTGERMIIKPYPKDDEPRTFGVRPGWLEEVAEHIRVDEIGRDELLFSTQLGTPISRTPSEPECGYRLSKHRASTSAFGYMIFGTRTRCGFSLAAQTSQADLWPPVDSSRVAIKPAVALKASHYES